MVKITLATMDYFKRDFAEAQEKYLSSSATGAVSRSVRGNLANYFELSGEIGIEEYLNLCEGRDPRTGESLTRMAVQRRIVDGKLVEDEKRPGWDITISPPKSFSAAALIGKDLRLFKAHREAVDETLAEVERFVQAHLGGNRGKETTGKAMFVLFEHDSDRPVDGYVAPQLHTHCFLFNFTQLPDGSWRALDTHELYKIQHYLTTYYRAVLSAKVMRLGYEIEKGKGGAWELRGFDREYIEAQSPRWRQKNERLAELGLEDNARNAEFAVLDTREDKREIDHEKVEADWLRVEAEYGNQSLEAVRAALERGVVEPETSPEYLSELLRSAMTYAVNRAMQRQAVVDETEILTSAMKYEMGEVDPREAKRALAQALEAGHLIEVEQRMKGSPQAAVTTPEMVKLETDIIRTMLRGRGKFGRYASPAEIAEVVAEFEERKSVEKGERVELNASQRRAVNEVLKSSDRIHALAGKAGTGKSWSLEIVKDICERTGFVVEGFAPTGNAARKLEESGIRSRTLQGFILSNAERDDSRPHLYVVDESSIASTVMMWSFLKRIGPDDRVLIVGDTRQHLAVEAGTPMEVLLNFGMESSTLDEIVRQKNPELLRVVSRLSDGKVKEALELMKELRYRDGDRRDLSAVVVEPDREKRLASMIAEFLIDPNETLMVSPDNRTRAALNAGVHDALTAKGTLGEEREVGILAARGDLTPEDKGRSVNYEVGDIVFYRSSSRHAEAGEYATVVGRHERWTRNQVTVRFDDGREATYNPSRATGVELYRREKRRYAVGDRIQFTTGFRNHDIVNRELATVTGFTERGVEVEAENKRVELTWDEVRHTDYGYAMTSHSAQGETVKKVLIHAESSQAEVLLNPRMAYVGVSRASMHAYWYTDDFEEMGRRAMRNHGKASAVERLNERTGDRASISRDEFSGERAERLHDVTVFEPPEGKRTEPKRVLKSPRPDIEEIEETGPGVNYRSAGLVLGYELAARLQLKHDEWLLELLNRTAEMRRFDITDEGVERDLSKFDVRRREALREQSSEKATVGLVVPPGREGIEVPDHSTEHRLSEKLEDMIDRLEKRIEASRAFLESVSQPADGIRERFGGVVPADEIVVRREVLMRLHEQACDRRDTETIKRLHSIRKAQAVKYAAPEWKSEEQRRLGALYRLGRIEHDAAVRRLEGFEGGFQHWKFEVEGGNRLSLADVEGRLRWKSGELEFKRRVIPVMRNAEKRAGYEADVNRLEEEIPAIAAMRPEIVRHIEETRTRLTGEVEERSAYLTCLGSLGVNVREVEPEFTSRELVRVERAAMDAGDADLLREYERYVAKSGMLTGEARTFLRQRAKARERIAEVRLERATAARVGFEETKHGSRVLLRTPEGEIGTGSLRELDFRSMNEVFVRNFTRGLHGETGSGLERAALESSALSGFKKAEVEFNRQAGMSAGELVRSMRERFGSRNDLASRFLTGVLDSAARGFSENVETMNRRRLIEQVVEARLSGLAERERKAFEFLKTCRELTAKESAGGESPHVVPIFTTKDAIFLEHHGIVTQREGVAAEGVHAAAGAAKARRLQGSDHPLEWKFTERAVPVSALTHRPERIVEHEAGVLSR